MDFKKVFIGIGGKDSHLFIGEGTRERSGKINFKNKSENRDFEIVNAVATMMRMRGDRADNKHKGWFGYDLSVGNLILVKPGYIAEIRKKRIGDPDKPIELDN